MSREIEELMDSLSWEYDDAVQGEAVELLVASGDRLDLSLLLQRGSKSRWQNEARVLVGLGYPRFREVIPSMLEWLQDLNWPGASEIFEALSSVPKSELARHVSVAALRALAERDAEWLDGLRELVRQVGLAAESMPDDRVREALFKSEEDG